METFLFAVLTTAIIYATFRFACSVLGNNTFAQKAGWAIMILFFVTILFFRY